ncbi:hypothetical protein GCM10027290_30430 [Micromonospora sonneratiae]
MGAGPRPAARRIRWLWAWTQYHLIERYPLPVQEELPAQRMPARVGSRGAVTNRAIEADRVRRLLRTVLAQGEPGAVVVERARYCGFLVTMCLCCRMATSTFCQGVPRLPA